jgi:TolB-like protein
MVLFRELKRRKVLHTLSLYVVGCWVALQVVEVLSEAGLPPGTMRQVLIAMSFGFPFVLIISWFYDISANGIKRTAPLSAEDKSPELNLGDFALTVGLVAVVALNVYVLSSPPPTQAASVPAVEQRTLVVLPFDDIDVESDEDPIGDVLAGELRSEFSQIAGLRVLGPETSRIIKAASDEYAVATELGVTSILTGDTQLKDGKLTLQVRVRQLPAGNIVWQSEYQDTTSAAVALQKSVVQAVLEAIIPSASAETGHAPRINAGECRDVYDLYLRGKQLRESNNWKRGLELLQEAVRIDPNCAVAWEALAAASIVIWSKEDFARAGAAARRALELNESLPTAWAVLAEIAEEEKRWNEAEKLFLRALYVDPTNAHVNTYYGETLLARGRVREALHYSMEGYRYDPASRSANFHVALAATYLEDGETALKHALINADLRKDSSYDGWGEIADAYVILGEVDKALAMYAEHSEEFADWYPQCIQARVQPELREDLPARMQATNDQYENGEFTKWEWVSHGWTIVRCGTWIGEVDMAVDLMANEDMTTEQQFLPFFYADSGVLRQTEFFRSKVIESGLLDYWRKWGWSDYCRPDGDSFVCD